MNMLTKIYKTLTGKYEYVTRKETRYEVSILVKKDNVQSSFFIHAILKDYPRNNEYYEVVSYRTPPDIDNIRGLDAPIHKLANKTKINIICTYEVEMTEKMYR